MIRLTPEGEGVVREVTSRRKEAIGEIVQEMPSERRRVLVEALLAFAEAADEASGPRGLRPPPCGDPRLGW